MHFSSCIEDENIKPYTYEKIQNIANFILERTSIKPKIGVICGSGLGKLLDNMTDATILKYKDIPDFPVTTVPGQLGELAIGKLSGVETLCMKGRFHLYEGYPAWLCAMPVRVMKLCGVTLLITTNSAGGINPTYRRGDVMIIKDHINYPGLVGLNPLLGTHDKRFGARFPPLNDAYNSELNEIALKLWSKKNSSNAIHTGIYACISGPNFETTAEMRMLKFVGVDAVGMSTAYEIIVATQCGMKTFGISLITDECSTSYDKILVTTHEEVVSAAKKTEGEIRNFLTIFVDHLRETLLK